MPDQIAIAEDLFTPGPRPSLIAGRERTSGRIIFPYLQDTERLERIELPRRGTLWSWTIQRFRPKTPPYIGAEAFEAFAVGYVELPDAILVEGRLTGMDFADLKIGMELELTLLPFAKDAAGNDLVTYAFRPARDGAG